MPTVGVMTAMTRGRLPARVYWTRRVLALVVVTGIVVGLVQLVSLAFGGGTPSEPDRATPAAAEVSGSPTDDPTSEETEESGQDRQRDPKGKKDKKGDRGPVLAEPEGPCVDRDIAVTPTAGKTVGGGPVTFTLELRTVQSPACTWEVSPQSLQVKITSGDDGIWYSRQCRRSIPTQDLVLRNNVSTQVDVTWSSRRSDDGCTYRTDWAMPGWYHIEAAALAGEPSDLQFRLTAPEPGVEYEKVPPPKHRQGKGDQGDQQDEKPKNQRDGRG